MELLESTVQKEYGRGLTEPVRADLERNKIPGWSFINSIPEEES